ncbi:HK97-gp10 family putative phage morphogenesis protein [Klebsiella quasipneumoniae]|uniref:HK97-gp10 family putative phage morphogenesis protein n=1 Tax=Klebsiella quasipneumoniae TaxID=1463165 RepID=UPI00220CA29D|nr:HK97-gp10 family putative phage morphogenesis protein [Klebsiella quasipneumoniae]BDO02221.1 hypothetical protein KAM622c_18080 [Klebsiella quasipneumoniae subsp. quasipneumoniae]
MADGVEVNLTGLDSVLGKLDAVSQVTRDKSGRAALRKAANVIRDRARNNAARVDDPLTKEAIYKNIVVSFSSKAFRRTGDPTFRVGVMGGARQYANTKANVRKVIRDRARNNAARVDDPLTDTWYWRFLEFGTEHAAAKPVLRPAINGVDTDVINIFAAELEKSIDRAVRRAAKKGTPV